MSITQVRRAGFTIVELLIVIVVIGILATITVVAYNGIQTKARSAQLVSAIDAYEKALRIYAIDNNGMIPLTNIAGGATYYSVCLGDNYPAENGFKENSCMSYAPIPDTSAFDVRESLNTTFKQYIKTLPDVHEHTTSIDFSGNVMKSRGLTYMGSVNSSGVYTAVFSYSIKGNQTCGRGTKTVTTDYGPELTQCELRITP